MSQQFLYEQFNVLSQFGAISHELPNCIKNNLKPQHELRPYQTEAFCRMIYFLKNDFDGKQPRPYHLLFNMATGSGKTMIMAGAILYLYEQGYRNFLFFVNSNNIIQKTKDNFLNANTGKYLFAEKIIFEGNEIAVHEVETFDESDDKNINIKFTTIQQLHIDLNSTKENALTYEDFQNKKIVLIADEAHHLNAGTRQGDLFGTFEDTVQKIHEQNYDNVLLEFTATADYEDSNIKTKYLNKVLFRYDLAEFRKDGYSKEINLLRSQFDEKHRIIQALVLNLYRQELATSHNINLKPVILFKAKKTIAENDRNKENFHKLIENLTATGIDEVRDNQQIKILNKAFAFFDAKGINSNEIVKRLQSNFKPENCLSANDNELEKNQILLNTLEDENNPIRAIFAVQKLNEGWDVLNLFDIVRMYEGQNTGGSNNGSVGKTTIAEAQLIGRGARYYPFTLEKGQNKFTRKFDSDIDNDLKVLEELYYHTKEDNRYISELKKALVETGIYEDEDDFVEKELKLKESFKQTDFYKNAKVFYNLKIEKSHDKVKSLKDLNVRKTNIEFTLSSGKGTVTNLMEETVSTAETTLTERKSVSISDMPKHVVRFALTTNPFFYFNNLQKYCPKIKSSDEFISESDYLGGFGITFIGDKQHIGKITNADYLQALKILLKSIETEIKQNDAEYEGSSFTYGKLYEKFTDKKLHINKKVNEERTKGQEDFLTDKDWYAYNANYGTSEEKRFVEMFAGRFDNLKDNFSDIYLIRNEQVLKIYDEIGRAFEPDFVLFCKRKTGEEQVLQVFIEPKGGHLDSKDKWKEDFLKKMRDDKMTIEIGSDHFLITGVPFYNYNNENEFGRELDGVLSGSN
ncbi:MAG: DEAD/DEAH box helicase family protein [Bacteroidales bacterium]|nr:DEAD/DEAH box helicase family protein [Bacteroidales bacterium]